MRQLWYLVWVKLGVCGAHVCLQVNSFSPIALLSFSAVLLNPLHFAVCALCDGSNAESAGEEAR